MKIIKIKTTPNGLANGLAAYFGVSEEKNKELRAFAERLAADFKAGKIDFDTVSERINNCRILG